MLAEPHLFETGSIPLPASRFLCEHLHQNVFVWACISRIHAQVPAITAGQLAKTLRQKIPCGIDVAVVAGPASRAPRAIAFTFRSSMKIKSNSRTSRVVSACRAHWRSSMENSDAISYS